MRRRGICVRPKSLSSNCVCSEAISSGRGNQRPKVRFRQRVADKKHEQHGEQRDGHGADDHFCFETRAEMIFAAFDPQAHHGAEEDQPKNHQRGGDETGNRVESQNIAPIFRFERNAERAEGEHRSEQQDEKERAGGKSPALFGAEAAHCAPPFSWKLMRHNLSARDGHRVIRGAQTGATMRWTLFVQRQWQSSQFESAELGRHLFRTIASGQGQVKNGGCTFPVHLF